MPMVYKFSQLYIFKPVTSEKCLFVSLKIEKQFKMNSSLLKQKYKETCTTICSNKKSCQEYENRFEKKCFK